MTKWINKIKKTWYCYAGLYLFRREPIIILSPGRTGSMAISKALKEAGFFVFKVEFEDDSRGTAKFAQQHILYGKRPAKIIVLYRDHLSILMSYFFSKATKGWLPEAKAALENKDVSALVQLFNTQIIGTEREVIHREWYTKTLFAYLGRDTLPKPLVSFPADSDEHLVSNIPPYQVLSLQLTTPNDQKSNCIQKFLQTNKVIYVKKLNTSDDKSYYQTFKTFKELMTKSENV